MTEQPSGIKRVVFSFFSFINITRKVIVNFIFFLVLFLFVLALMGDNDEILIPNKTAVLLDLNGDIVEQKQLVDPLESFLNESFNQQPENPEVLLSDILDVIDEAKYDDRVKVLVLKLEKMKSSGITKLDIIGKQLESFKASGKPIIAIGDLFTQNQYYLASFADEIWLNPNGMVLLDGYGRYQLYFKSALEKLSVSSHIFRVGTYKSAVEPYMRDNMSVEAKEANQAWLSELWSHYKASVAERRGFPITNFDEEAQSLLTKLKTVDGKFSQYALENNWVDYLKTREQVNNDLTDLIGTNKYRAVSFEDYLAATKLPFEITNPNTDKVAVIVAKGTILDGHKKPGTIGGDSTAKLLKKARKNPNVKAVVLRVDSPGGSAFASDVIRQEVELLKQNGKPVVASMGTYAASGGYWISAAADKIVAAPTTITGSIGIFGFFMTFENTLAKLGINTDGVGTTDFAGMGVTTGLDDDISQIFQVGIERGYQDFLELVAENRKLTIKQVDKIAQGRVWTGSKALELGLVDQLGGLEDAIKAAGDLAQLPSYDTLLIQHELSTKDRFYQNLFGEIVTFLPEQNDVESAGPIEKIIRATLKEFALLEQLNDPQGTYAFCIACELPK
ncbi:signal peptide peptidase SppA [Thalassotalea ganghwensis]